MASNTLSVGSNNMVFGFGTNTKSDSEETALLSQLRKMSLILKHLTITPLPSDRVALNRGIACFEEMEPLFIQYGRSMRRKLNSTSPVCRLPPELLAELLLVACHDYLHWKPLEYVPHRGSAATRSLTTPLFLGSICTTWREIVWSNSRFWTSFSLEVSVTRSAAQACLLEEWIARTNNQTLSIVLSMEDEERNSIYDEPDDGGIIHVLASHAGQWGEIDFKVPLNWYSALEGTSASYLPNLSRAIIRLLNDEDSTYEPVTLFQLAPQLREVHLHGLSLPEVQVPYHQIEHFEGDCLTIQDCIEIISQCPKLRECNFSALQSPDEGHTVTAQGLVSLIITYTRGLQIVSLFSRLTSPSLQEVHISTSSRGTPFPLSSLISLVTRSTCNLTRLELHHFDREGQDLRIYLQHLPALIHLCLEMPVFFNDPVTPTLNENLDITSILEIDLARSPPILLHLQTFHYAGFVSNTFSYEKLADVLKQRWSVILTSEVDGSKPVQRLQSFSCDFIDFSAPSGAADIRLRALLEDGMCIHIKNSCWNEIWTKAEHYYH
ncbi:hypothetical protein BDQ12DRAFT_630892 [Crucibulum laeve]|uniref:F-box domain-containing protein n=1 Tax=Crucibulum laeve TaxID=68775 RepID=A0A5C3M249_9AGAR|nr:hypothetical protein BDQ12DRAFT_630892 [Crucibulum laeve]